MAMKRRNARCAACSRLAGVRGSAVLKVLWGHFRPLARGMRCPKAVSCSFASPVAIVNFVSLAKAAELLSANGPGQSKVARQEHLEKRTRPLERADTSGQPYSSRLMNVVS